MGKKAIKKFSPAKSPINIEEVVNHHKKIKLAYEFSKKAHSGQKRLSGKPYFNHTLEVANIILAWTNGKEITNTDLICAALLHDVTEETRISLPTIRKKFGSNIANLVDGVSKLKSKKRKEEDWLTLQKVIKRGYLDPKVFILKLADRIHNMRTLSFMPKEKQIQKAFETREVYAKLAEALGMWEVKVELEDLAYQYLDTRSFNRTKKEIENDKRVTISAKKTTQSLKKLLLKHDTQARVYPSVNGCWAVEAKKDKVVEKGISASHDIKSVNDVVSFRVLVENIENCYKALGVIEKHFGEAIDENRFDNYLVKPRINGYSALQTTVINNFGAIEIAITTIEREHFNRLGIVSLFTKRNNTTLSKFILKVVFNQSGEIMFLPKKATGLDALYKNPLTAASAEGIIVNGKKRSLTQTLPNGAVILGIYSKQVKRAPDKKLLEYVLPETKRLMLAQINLREKEKLIAKGKRKIKKLLIPRGVLSLSDINDTAWQLVYLCNAESVYDLLYKYAKGLIKDNQINKFLNKLGLIKEKRKISTVLIKGINKPGILAKVSNKIAKLGGDIVVIKNFNRGNRFTLRLLVKELDNKKEKVLQRYLEKDTLFDTVQIV